MTKALTFTVEHNIMKASTAREVIGVARTIVGSRLRKEELVSMKAGEHWYVSL
jgi:hypothetical protein